MPETDLTSFYGPEQAAIHHKAFGRLAVRAADQLLLELRHAGLTSGTIVDLGCGSGILAAIVSDAGYDVLAADVSPSMVAIARANAPRAQIVRASLYDVELPPAVGVVATGEALNYATDARAGPAAFEAFVGRVHKALAPGGILAFDISVHGRSGPTGVRQQFHDGEGWSVGVRETETEDRLSREIATFSLEPDGRYRRTDETHALHLFDQGQVEAVLRSARFEVTTAIDYGPPRFEAMPGWIVLVARRR